MADQPRYAFLTTEPEAMPVILEEADYGQWLTAPWEGARELVAAYPSQLMAVA